MYKKLNYAIGYVASTTAIGATTLTLKAGHTITTDTGGANKFVAVLYSGTKSSPYQDTTREIVEAYRTDTNDFVIARAKENTIAKEWVENDKFMLIASAGVFDEYETAVDAKAPLTAPTFATSITGSYLTASEMLITDANKKIISAPVATYPSLTELSYVKGLSSAIQSQLNAKGVGDMLLSGVQSVTGLKTFNKDKIAMKGTSTGVNTISVANTSATSYTNTLPAKNGTFAMTDDIVSQVEDNITDGHTTVAPSGNAVFDALALKAPLDSPLFTTLVSLANNIWLRFVNYAGTGYLNALKGTTNDELELGTTLNTGTIEVEDDAGAVTIIDMGVTSASADGTEMSYVVKIDGNNLLKIYTESDGAGGVDTFKVQLLNKAVLTMEDSVGTTHTYTSDTDGSLIIS